MTEEEETAADELCRRLTEVCQEYESGTIFVALASMLTVTCAQAANLAGLNEFIELFARRVRSFWLEQQAVGGRPQ